MELFCYVGICCHGSNCSVPGSRYDLTQILFADVACGKYPFDRCLHFVIGIDPSASGLFYYRPGFAKVGYVWLSAYKDEYSRYRKVRDFSCFDVLQHQLLYKSLTLDGFNNGVPDRFDLRI
ncbi:hypothetical protein SDC9_204598 [bioreactor metagenome]|uniref:Uncharacterized protein n=1 Tax=bioreactor metagenome TaxID=1076179 RepID=A0A645IZN1_9ZZZZ